MRQDPRARPAQHGGDHRSRRDSNSGAGRDDRCARYGARPVLAIVGRRVRRRTRLRRLPPLAGLVCNAGVQFTRRTLTADGMEATFATNHLGHLGLILDLLDHFTAPARILLVSSGTHDPDQFTGMPHPLHATAHELAYPPPPTESAQRDARRRYTTSKLANLRTAYHLARELAPRDITVNAFDPGLMPGTGLARDAGAFQRLAWKTIARALVVLPGVRTPQGSGADLAWLAAAPAREGITGQYLVRRTPVRSSAASYDEPEPSGRCIETAWSCSPSWMRAARRSATRPG